MIKTKQVKHIIILILLSCLFFILGNGILSLTNPDEVFYVQTAKEMARQNSWATPYMFGVPQFEKPIFTYWLLRLGFIIFGVTSFAVRFFPAIFALLGVLAIYCLCVIGFKNEKKAFISGIIFMSCGLCIGLARTVFTDMIFSIFILISLLAFFWSYSNKNKKSPGILLFFVSSALAVLTKGPLGLMIPLLIISSFLYIKKDIKFLFCKSFLWGVFIFLLVSLPWYLIMLNKYGGSFIREFFYNDHFRRLIEAEHPNNDKWYFYPFSMAGCMFPWSLYVLVAIFYSFKNIRRNSQALDIFLVCWLVIVFLLFQPAHSKLVSYIFPLFPALAIITGSLIYDVALSKNKSRLFFIISLVMSAIILLIPIGLIVVLVKYPAYASLRMPACVLILAILSLGGSMLFFILRGRMLKSIYILAALNMVFISVIPFVSKEIEGYASSKNACEYLLKNYKVDNVILCAKFFVRGVKYYTDKEVAVMDIPGKQFFSPHPVPFLDSDDKVRAFLSKQSV
ncbi:glycosyltransferase family 39 protein, partial [bacterium]